MWRCFTAKKAISVHSAHRECYGTSRDEDTTCSRGNRPFLNLPESITRHNNYYNITFEKFCEESSSLQVKTVRVRKERWGPLTSIEGGCDMKVKSILLSTAYYKPIT